MKQPHGLRVDIAHAVDRKVLVPKDVRDRAITEGDIPVQFQGYEVILEVVPAFFVN